MIEERYSVTLTGDEEFFTIYDHKQDDYYYDEQGWNPVFGTEEEAEEYMNKYLVK